MGGGGWQGRPHVSVLPPPRCLGKLQLFQPSFEICPFETELNMDIAAALKVCSKAQWRPAAKPSPPLPCLPNPAPLHNGLLPTSSSSLQSTMLSWWCLLQRGNREWYDRILNAKSPREQVQLWGTLAVRGTGSREVGTS